MEQIIGIVPITHMRNKNSNTQGSSPNVVKVIFHTLILFVCFVALRQSQQLWSWRDSQFA